MGKPLFANNAAVFLTTAVAAADLTLALPANSGSRFPAPAGGDWFMLTVENLQAGLREIVRVTARTGDTLTVVRAQEGTAATSFPDSGTVASHRLTAGGLAILRDGTAASFATLADGPGALAGHAYQTPRVNSGGTALEYVDRPFEGSLQVDATKPTAAEVLLRHKMSGAVRVSAGLAGWQFAGAVNAAAATVLSVRRNGTEFGTITIAAGTTTASFAAAAATDFASGDVLTIVAPPVPDATLAAFSVTVYAMRL